MLPSLTHAYRALVIGSSGTIGHAFVDALQRDSRCAEVVTVNRLHPMPWDLRDAASIEALAGVLEGPFHLVVDATGALTIDGRGPEKRLSDLTGDGLHTALDVNTVGPLLLLRHLSPLLVRGERVIWAKLSARVGSIEDNRKGGWYSYRMAKAALNQGLQTATRLPAQPTGPGMGDMEAAAIDSADRHPPTWFRHDARLVGPARRVVPCGRA